MNINLTITSFLFKFRDNDVVHDPDVKKTVVDQTKQWSDMMGKHRTEEWELRRLICLLFIHNL